jgi:hypothetical protein
MIYTRKLFLAFPAMTNLMVVGTLMATGMEVYGQQQEQQTSTPPTSSSPTGQAAEFQKHLIWRIVPSILADLS